MKRLAWVGSSLLAAMATAAPTITISYPQLDNPYYTAARRYVAQAYHRIGIDTEFIGMPGQRSLISANEGVTDAEMLRIKPLPGNYPNLIPLGVPLYSAPIMVFTIKEHFTVKGWDSLRPYVIGSWNGFKLVETRTEGMKRQFVQDAESMFRMLQRGRVDVAVQDRSTGLMWLRRLNLERTVRMLQPPLEMSTTYHYVNKKHADLIPRLEQAFEAMQRQHLFERYLDEAEKESDKNWWAEPAKE
jgi:polar amino acid transport system substrate-binding protein